MASAIQITQELEDLITCPICLCEYEESSEDHKPKLLFCSHTLCCQCLKVSDTFTIVLIISKNKTEYSTA